MFPTLVQIYRSSSFIRPVFLTEEQKPAKNTPDPFTTNYRGLFPSHPPRMSSPGSPWAKTVLASVLSLLSQLIFCSGRCLRTRFWRCTAPVANLPTPASTLQTSAVPAPLLHGEIAELLQPPPWRFIPLTAQTDNCASAAEQSKHKRGRNGQPADRGEVPQLPTRDSLNQPLVGFCLPWPSAISEGMRTEI